MSEPENPIAHGHLSGVFDPRDHDFLTGHESVREQITHAFSGGRFPQAWMLTGQLGVGKATIAWHFARQLVGTGEIREGYSADEATLARYRAHNHPRIYTISPPPDDKGGFKSQIPIDAIRKLSGQLHLAATEGGYRVVIIDPAEAMNPNAANALLKLLEEPPAKTIFFLITHAPNLLLPTIKSRCQVLRIGGLSIPDIQTIWPQVTDEPTPEASTIDLAEGSMRAALQMRGDEAALYAQMLTLLSSAPNIPREPILQMASRMNDGNRASTLARAKNLFTLLTGRILRAATQPGETPEAIVAARIAPPNAWGNWATFGFESARILDEAALLNLDPEITIFGRWTALDEMIKNS